MLIFDCSLYLCLHKFWSSLKSPQNIQIFRSLDLLSCRLAMPLVARNSGASLLSGGNCTVPQLFVKIIMID